jgi:cytochrome bd ubiquinol oxidase subunit II
MPEVWFFLVAAMIAMYFVLDGFDFGAAMVRPFVAKTEGERANILEAIGPYWDGNEVWLIAAGGVSLCVFPAAFASVFAGLYLPLFMVLWALVLRGLSIELSHLSEDSMWVAFWDFGFTASGYLLALLLGVAAGNVLRGFPLDADGAFDLELFSSARPAVLDAYTLTVGAATSAAFALQGAAFLAMKTGGPLGARSESARRLLGVLTGVLFVAAFVLTLRVRPELVASLLGRPVAFVPLAIATGGLALAMRRGHAALAFAGTSALILGSAVALAIAAFPVLVFSMAQPELSLVATGESGGLRVALSWWVVGMVLVGGYYVTLARIHRGKVT